MHETLRLTTLVSGSMRGLSERPENCPPADAKPANRKFFRFVRGSADEQAEWLLPYLTPGAGFGKTGVCAAHAYSLLGEMEDIAVARRFMGKFRRMRVAEVTLRPDMGVVKHTPSRVGRSHHSWWPEPVDVIPPVEVVQ